MDEIVKKVIDYAKYDERIRFVIMNGSRVNPKAPKDDYQDYDIVYGTNGPEAFNDITDFINTFGELVMKQHNYLNHGAHIFLMLFKAGIRIDLTIHPLTNLEELTRDSLSIVLLDKDGILPDLPEPNEKSYYIKKPDEIEFQETVNDFLWCLNNVAKGIKRDELVYVKTMFDYFVRKALIQVILWYIVLEYDYQVNTGAYGKWIKHFLPKELYDMLKATYMGNDYEEIWKAVFTACKLMRTVGMRVAADLGYAYPLKDDMNMVAYLEKVRLI